jgi:hypothetical protein
MIALILRPLAILFLLPSWQVVVNPIVVLVCNLVYAFEAELLIPKKKLSENTIPKVDLYEKGCAPLALHTRP